MTEYKELSTYPRQTVEATRMEYIGSVLLSGNTQEKIDKLRIEADARRNSRRSIRRGIFSF